LGTCKDPIILHPGNEVKADVKPSLGVNGGYLNGEYVDKDPGLAGQQLLE
jgi:hypothetical protein